MGRGHLLRFCDQAKDCIPPPAGMAGTFKKNVENIINSPKFAPASVPSEHSPANEVPLKSSV
jgi:hypothetical protein